MGARGAPKTGGRAPGTPNKATADARSAIATFVNGNADRLQDWLDKVANGVQDDEGNWVVAPNPEKAFSLFQSVIEYHVPKLARTEMTGADGGPMQVQNMPLVINGVKIGK